MWFLCCFIFYLIKCLYKSGLENPNDTFKPIHFKFCESVPHVQAPFIFRKHWRETLHSYRQEYFVFQLSSFVKTSIPFIDLFFLKLLKRMMEIDQVLFNAWLAMHDCFNRLTANCESVDNSSYIWQTVYCAHSTHAFCAVQNDSPTSHITYSFLALYFVQS